MRPSVLVTFRSRSSSRGPGAGSRRITSWRLVEKSAGDLTTNLQEVIRLEPAPGPLELDLLRNVTRTLGRIFDQTHGGFGNAPKFPHPMDLRLLLRLWKRFGDDTALSMVRKTLD